ncbi:MAG: hypothetical protein ACR2GA_05005 [Chloroflexota bacterium]
MTHDPSNLIPDPGDTTPQQQLVGAVRDLWSMVQDAGEDYVVLVDRRRLNARVERGDGGLYAVSWEEEDGSRVIFGEHFSNPREAVFHAYQGPH